jgi:hypothetical protein
MTTLTDVAMLIRQNLPLPAGLTTAGDLYAGDDDQDALERYLDSEEDPSLPMRVVAFNFEGTR